MKPETLLRFLRQEITPNRSVDALVYEHFMDGWSVSSQTPGEVIHMARPERKQAPRYTESFDVCLLLWRMIKPVGWKWAKSVQGEITLAAPDNPTHHEDVIGLVPNSLCRSMLVALVVLKTHMDEKDKQQNG